ncbi:MAG: S1 RNA-binding domain-containing protein, partial [Actinobacteria bacterium]|nr:S1 RNA-binding domain-containing protein [Actinomycetota bacterium]
GHFGLGFPEYTHFTSPIRRYPDLLVHRAIRHLIRNKPGAHLQKHELANKLDKKKIYSYGASEMDGFGVNCSAAERRADAASYNVIDWLKCEYMLSHVGDEFFGTIISVTSFGLFVELDDIYIEGLVHISELSDDYYHFDPVRHCLEGERSKQVYRLGDRLEVKVVRVDIEEKKIELQAKGFKQSTSKWNKKQASSKSRKLKSEKLRKTKSGANHETVKSSEKTTQKKSKLSKNKRANSKSSQNPTFEKKSGNSNKSNAKKNEAKQISAKRGRDRN